MGVVPTRRLEPDRGAPRVACRPITTPLTLVPVVRVVIPMVIQAIQPDPPGPNGTDDPPHVTGLDPTGADQSDAEHSPTDLAVGGSSPSRRATFPHVSRHVSGKQHPFGSSLD
jgi:hypothetical protein